MVLAKICPEYMTLKTSHAKIRTGAGQVMTFKYQIISYMLNYVQINGE